MEPKFSLTAYVVVLCVAGVATSLLVGPGPLVWTSAAVLTSGFLLNVSYRFRTRKFPRRRLPHRSLLDRTVLVQWLGQAVVCCVAVVLVEVQDWRIDRAPTALAALALGAMLGAAVVYISALIDWYWVLPKISGMTGPLPCIDVADGQFRLVTKLWFAHRASATALITVILVGVPGYLASDADNGGLGAGWAILGAALSIGYGRVGGDIVSAFGYFLSPPVRVAKVVRIRPDPASHVLEDALIVDVSIQGAHYKTFAQIDALSTPEFVEPGTLLKIGELSDVMSSPRTAPACVRAADCKAMNWYCFRNPSAHSLAGAKTQPAHWLGD